MPKLTRQHLPNFISLSRLGLTPLLVYLIFARRETAYLALLVVALASDAADGFLARRLDACTRLGAILDSIADTLVMGTVVVAIWVFHPNVYSEHGLPIVLVVIFASLAHLAAFVRYGRPSGFHTRLARLGIQLFSTFALVLFLIGFYPWLLYTAAAVSIVAMWEQLAMVYLLPDWAPDRHGGLRELVKDRRRTKIHDSAKPKRL